MRGERVITTLTRRRFLAFSGVAAGALALGATTVSWPALLDAAVERPRPPGAGVLVMVSLYGGNDGLATVVPAVDEAYQAARHDIAYQPDEVLDLGEGLGLNPGLAGLKSLWDDGALAVVRGVGYPRPDHSHFRSMAIWQTASPTTPTGAGWLGRWLDATGDDPLRALSLESVVPPFLVGERVAAATLPAGGLDAPPGAVGNALMALGAADPADDELRARAARSVADLGTVRSRVGDVVRRRPDGGGGQLAGQLELVGDLVEAGAPTRVYSASLGGFDTHADERATQERLLRVLDGALSGFVRRMLGSPAGRDVVVVVYSEFGRRVRANLGHGTDHGTAAPVLILGHQVGSGFHGTQPSLTDLDDGDLRWHVDFRSVYAGLLESVLGADADAVMRAEWPRVPGLFAGERR
jgi:uncharacterized protein (DUF1501 family)